MAQQWKTVMEGGFGANYATDYDWDRDPDADVGNGVLDRNFTTLNGSDAVEIIHRLGSTTSDRWGGRFDTPAAYEEGRFTYDFKFDSPHSSPKGQKLPAIMGGGVGAGAGSNQPGDPDGGWFCRTLSGGLSSPFTGDISCGLDVESFGGIEDIFFNGVQGDPVLVQDVVNRIRIYWKINSAFDQADGIVRVWYDPGDAINHAEPITLRGERTDLQFYAGSEANRSTSFIDQLNYITFHGGANSSWDVLADTNTIYGGFTVEIPVNVTETSFATPSTDHLVAMPDAEDVEVGNLLKVLISIRAATTIQTPVGWVKAWEANPAGGVVASFLRVANGLEGGTQVNFVTSVAGEGAAQARVISDWFGTLAGVEWETAIVGSSANPNPPALAASWGALPGNLFLAEFGAENDDATVTTYPANYERGVDTISGGGLNAGATVGSAERELNSGLDDPGAFTLSELEGWVANTTVIRPADAGVNLQMFKGSLSSTGKVMGLDRNLDMQQGVMTFVGKVLSLGASRLFVMVQATPTLSGKALSTGLGLPLGMIAVDEEPRPTLTLTGKVLIKDPRTFTLVKADLTLTGGELTLTLPGSTNIVPGALNLVGNILQMSLGGSAPEGPWNERAPDITIGIWVEAEPPS